MWGVHLKRSLRADHSVPLRADSAALLRADHALLHGSRRTVESGSCCTTESGLRGALESRWRRTAWGFPVICDLHRRMIPLFERGQYHDKRMPGKNHSSFLTHKLTRTRTRAPADGQAWLCLDTYYIQNTMYIRSCTCFQEQTWDYVFLNKHTAFIRIYTKALVSSHWALIQRHSTHAHMRTTTHVHTHTCALVHGSD